MKAIGLSILAFSVQNAMASITVDANPVTVTTGTTPLNLIVASKDHTLWTPAYNNIADLDGDSIPDVGYQPSRFDYYGYFDSNKCYTYSGNQFTPAKIGRALSVNNLGTSGTHNTYKLCSPTNGTKASYWSGDFLNYLTMARIDVLRKVLFGGKRNSQAGKPDVLGRALIPQDAHAWGYQYTSNSVNGFKIEDYAPLDSPTGSNNILFANVTKIGSTDPLLRYVVTNKTIDTWINRPQISTTDTIAGDKLYDMVTKTTTAISPTDLTVNVVSCINTVTSDVAGKAYTTATDPDGVLMMDSSCKDYAGSGNYRPIGILQKYGESNKMLFGLMTGSFDQNTAGAVLRRDIDDLTPQNGGTSARYGHNVDYTSNNGNYNGANAAGIIVPMKDMEILAGYDKPSKSATTANWSCGYIDPTDLSKVKTCGEWGEPTGEMFYEALRYFLSNNRKATASFVTSQTKDGNRGLAQFDTAQNPGWFEQPFGSSVQSNKNASVYTKAFCAKPFVTYFGTNAPSWDSDDIPSAAGTTFAGLNINTLGATLWNREFGGSKNVLVGEDASQATNDFAPTAKSINNFANIKGVLSKPNQKGTYYTAILANYGREHGLDVPDTRVDKNGNVVTTGQTTNVKVNTTAVVFPPFVQQLELPITVDGSTKKIRLLPFSVTLKADYLTKGTTAPITNEILQQNIVKMANLPGMTTDNSTNGGRPYMSIDVYFDSTDVGGDRTPKVKVNYEFFVNNDNNAVVHVTNTASTDESGKDKHIGYSITGTTEDNVYTVVRDNYTRVTSGQTKYRYMYDQTLPDGTALVNESTKVFTPADVATVSNRLKDPLYYAAKYGGYSGDKVLTNPTLQKSQWDNDNDGIPDSYFNVTSPLKLEQQMADAFASIMARVGSGGSVATSSTSLNNGLRLYQATFNTKDWSGDLVSLPLVNGVLMDPDWSVASKLTDAGSRKIITYNPDTLNGNAFVWANLTATQKAALNANGTDTYGALRLNYLRGSRYGEGDVFRQRETLMGDVINSSPVYVANPLDVWGDAEYIKYKAAHKNRKAVVYVGANDGMLHAFDATLQSVDGTLVNSATSGNELFAFVPGDTTLYSNLHNLSNPNYNNNHKYFVDGNPIVRDVRTTTGCTATAGYCYKTMLFGGLNAGGKSIYALDVTDSDNFATNTQDDMASIVKWQFTNTSMLSSYGRPFIINTNASNTKASWVAFTNGLDVNSGTTSDGYLYIINADGPQNTVAGKKEWAVNMASPTVIDSVKIRLGASTNGASEVSCVDIGKATAFQRISDGIDQKSDLCYVGDPKGNLWRVDLTSSNPLEWRVTNNATTAAQTAVGVPIFKTADNQPIYTAPEITYLPDGSISSTDTVNKNLLVYVGTGQFLSSLDKATAATNTAISTATQSVYAVLDKNLMINNTYEASAIPADEKVERPKMEKRAISTVTADSGEQYRIISPVTSSITGTTTDGSLCWESTSTNCPSLPVDRGWYIDFPSTGTDASGNYNPAERFMGTLQLFGKNLYFNSLIPNEDACSYGGSGWLLAVDYATGLSPSANIFDTNNDGAVNSEDSLTDNKLIAAGKKIGGTLGGSTIIKSVVDGKDALAITSLLSGVLQTTTINGKSRQERTLSWKEYFR